MRRGFKSNSEKSALTVRSDFKLTPFEKINLRTYLGKQGIVVWGPADIPGVSQEHVDQLTVHDPDSWSGITVREGDAIAIIVNPTHPKTRQLNTLAHEWAHIHLRHKPNRVDHFENGLLLLSDYPAEIEDEANWLGGALLAPRDGLLFHRKSGLEPAQVAEHYGISTELANWRLRMTGVERQLRASY